MTYCKIWVIETMPEKMLGGLTDSDWLEYRRKRNDCSKALKKLKNEYFKDIFQTLCETKDVKNTYNTAKISWAGNLLDSQKCSW